MMECWTWGSDCEVFILLTLASDSSAVWRRFGQFSLLHRGLEGFPCECIFIQLGRRRGATTVFHFALQVHNHNLYALSTFLFGLTRHRVPCTQFNQPLNSVAQFIAPGHIMKSKEVIKRSVMKGTHIQKLIIVLQHRRSKAFPPMWADLPGRPRNILKCHCYKLYYCDRCDFLCTQEKVKLMPGRIQQHLCLEAPWTQTVSPGMERTMDRSSSYGLGSRVTLLPHKLWIIMVSWFTTRPRCR